jgi:hypothetical protein
MDALYSFKMMVLIILPTKKRGAILYARSDFSIFYII